MCVIRRSMFDEVTATKGNENDWFGVGNGTSKETGPKGK